MATQVRMTTIPAAMSPAVRTCGEFGPSRGIRIAGTRMLTGHTAIHVSRAIFQRGGMGAWGLRNQASRPSPMVVWLVLRLARGERSDEFALLASIDSPWACGKKYVAERQSATSFTGRRGARRSPSLLLRGSLSHKARHEVPVVRDVDREEVAQALDVVAPVAVQLAGDAEPVHELRARR